MPQPRSVRELRQRPAQVMAALAEPGTSSSCRTLAQIVAKDVASWQRALTFTGGVLRNHEAAGRAVRTGEVEPGPYNNSPSQVWAATDEGRKWLAALRERAGRDQAAAEAKAAQRALRTQQDNAIRNLRHEGLGPSAIAAQVGMPLSTVRNRLRKINPSEGALPA